MHNDVMAAAQSTPALVTGDDGALGKVVGFVTEAPTGPTRDAILGAQNLLKMLQQHRCAPQQARIAAQHTGELLILCLTQYSLNVRRQHFTPTLLATAAVAPASFVDSSSSSAQGQEQQPGGRGSLLLLLQAAAAPARLTVSLLCLSLLDTA
jgi:hypothetical protein